jgi:hypothetical protein
VKAGPAWVALFSGIAAYDWWAIRQGHETLSGAFWRHLERYPTRIGLTLVATLLYKHLVAPGILPAVDPLRPLANRWHRNSNADGSVTEVR